MLAEILEGEIQFTVHLLVDLRRDADAAGVGEGLDARRDIDTVAVDAVAFHHQVAQVDADAERHATLLGERRIARAQLRLHRERSLHCVHRAAELGEDIVARHVHNPAVLRRDDAGDGAAVLRERAHGR